MWIKRSEYEEIKSDYATKKRECDEWKAKYRAVAENTPTYMGNDAIVISTKALADFSLDADRTREENKSLRHELDTWKQKYSDEVQKRIVFIEQMNNKLNNKGD